MTLLLEDAGRNMTTLQDVVDIASQDQFLAVVSTLREHATIQASVVNAGVLTHPFTGTEVVAFVTYGKQKLANLRSRPQLTVTFRSGWQWASVEGLAELIGPDDPYPDVDAEALRLLLRQVFGAAGGAHDDWEEFDRTMKEQRRTVVLLTPSRLYSN
jgi:PPOX class probable F420-dependent enzyme